MTSNKRKCFSIEEKAAIIHRLESGESNSNVAKEFGVSHSTVSTIFKNKDKIEILFNASVLKSKRVRSSTQDKVDTALLEWFKLQRNRGLPVNGPILQEKANHFAQQLKIPDFTCSTSWINRFKIRHNIVAGKIVGESLSVQQTDVNDWLTKVWPHLRANFTDDEIFNADEAGLFYKLTPNRTLKFKGQNCIGGKLSKDRLTVLIAANMTGTTKKKLFVIGKSKNPRCFKNMRSLPVDYTSNHKAWMTSNIFTKWVRDWDRELANKKKKILLLVDNCPAHPTISDLKSVTLIFLPPNTTSVLQPMDQGVIRSFKSYFRKNLLLKIIECADNNKSDTIKQPQISILDAILMMYDSWNKVSQSTIFNCFRHAGFTKDNAIVCSVVNSCTSDDEDDIPLSVWVKALQQNLPLEREELEQFATIDDNVVTCEELSEETIVQNLINVNEDSDDSTDDSNDEYGKSLIPSTSEALRCAEQLNLFIHANVEDENLKYMMSRIHNAVRTKYVYTKNQNQTKITQFLSNL